MLKNAFNWLKARLQERSTKQHFLTFVFLLASLGVIKPDTADKLTTIVETGQEIVHDGADSVAVTIDRGKDLFEEGKDLATDTRDTALYFWYKVLVLLGAGMSVVGMASKDAKAGVEYDHREEIMRQKAEAFNVDISL